MSFYVTTPIYYVNARPHLGHAYTTIGADVVARHMRQRGEDVFFLTGTDEHGEPVQEAAARLGVSPQELADRNVVYFKDMVERVEATNDFFIRTTDPRHVSEVQSFMQALYDRGDIYKGSYEGWYCPACADFKSEKEVVDGNRCPVHKIDLRWEAEENYFFRLSAYQERLEELYREHPEFVVPRHRYNEALSFIKQGLVDISVTRSKLQWGVPAPWDPSQVIYVWFDALLNYVSALRFARDRDLTDRFWPANLHIMAKDILKFHAVFWPAMLMAGELPLPKRMFVHGYLMMEGHKMSKSLGNVLDPFEAIDEYGADALRYYLMREVSFGHDGAVSMAGFKARYNGELANEFGNLAGRVVAMVTRYLDGVVADPSALSRDRARPGDVVAGEADAPRSIVGVPETFPEFGPEFVERYRRAMDNVELSAALGLAWELVRRLNRYVEEQAPWKLAKDPERRADLESALFNLVEGLRVTATLLHPFLPAACATLLEALGCGSEPQPFSAAGPGSGPDKYTVTPLPPLFPKTSD